MNSGYEWDEAKRQINLDQHALDFEDVHRFGWDTAVIRSSDRSGESRWIAYAYFESRLHAVVYTWRGDVKRIISFRPTRLSEVQRHG